MYPLKYATNFPIFILSLLCHLQKRKLDAVYYYMRSLAASNPILTAKESLMSLFEEAKRKVRHTPFLFCNHSSPFIHTSMHILVISSLLHYNNLVITPRLRVRPSCLLTLFLKAEQLERRKKQEHEGGSKGPAVRGRVRGEEGARVEIWIRSSGQAANPSSQRGGSESSRDSEQDGELGSLSATDVSLFPLSHMHMFKNVWTLHIQSFVLLNFFANYCVCPHLYLRYIYMNYQV